MDSTLALAITKVFLEEMDKANEVVTEAATVTAKTTKVTKVTKKAVKKQEKKSDGNNSNC